MNYPIDQATGEWIVDPKIDFRFDPERHIYTLAGKVLQSVTKIIGAILPMPPVDPWYLDRGHKTHLACQLLDEGRLDWSSVDAEIEPRVKAWEKFRRDYPAEIIANERPLAHPTLGYAGCVDRILSGPGNRLTVCDLKNSVTPRVYLQLALYSILWADNGNPRPRQGLAVELKEDGNYTCHWLDRYGLQRAEQQALALLTVYGFAEQHKLLRAR